MDPSRARTRPTHDTAGPRLPRRRAASALLAAAAATFIVLPSASAQAATSHAAQVGAGTPGATHVVGTTASHDITRVATARRVPWWRTPYPTITGGAALDRTWTRARRENRLIASRVAAALHRAAGVSGAPKAAATATAARWLGRYRARNTALVRAHRAAIAESRRPTARGRRIAALESCLARGSEQERLLQEHASALARWRSSVLQERRAAARRARSVQRRQAAALVRNWRGLAGCIRASRGNHVVNSSFEFGVAGWSGWNATISRLRDPEAPDGRWVARVTRSAGDAYTIDDWPSSIASADPAATYVARASVRAATPSAVGKPAAITLREGTPSDSVRQVHGPVVMLTTDYQQVAVEIGGHAAGNEIDVHVGQFDATPGDAMLVDRISITKQARPGASSGG